MTVGILALSALTGCQGSSSLTPRPLVSGGPVRVVGGETFALRVRLQLDGPGNNLRTKGIPPGWDQAVIGLFNADTLKGGSRSTASPIPKTSFTNNATTSPPVEFTNLRPGGGYVLEVRLQKCVASLCSATEDVGSGATGPLTLTAVGSPQLVNVLIHFTYLNVTTLAGQPSPGTADGTGTAAQFNNPIGVATDGAGNIYVADTLNHCIRKIDSVLNVTSLAGSCGIIGFVDGTGTAGRFNQPYDIAMAGNGDLIVADASNNAIRRVTPMGVVTTIVPTGVSSPIPGSSDGSLAAAHFSNPRGLTLDGSGTIFVADTANHRIRKIDLTNTGNEVSTLAGSTSGFADGTGTSAQFNTPSSIVFNPVDGKLYVADPNNYRIRKVDSATGTVTTLAGNGTSAFLDGLGTSASFTLPLGIAVDSDGNLYVSDGSTSCALGSTLRQVTREGRVSLLAGNPSTCGVSNGYALDAKFRNPQGIAVQTDGTIFIGDTENHRIRKLTGQSAAHPLIDTVSPLGGAPGITVIIAGTGFSNTSNTVTFNGTQASSVTETSSLLGAIVPAGATAGPVNVSHHGLSSLLGLFFQVIYPTYTVTTIAGPLPTPFPSAGFSDGTGGSALFNSPVGIVTDGTDLYVADQNNHRIRKVTTGGVVTTVAGNGTAAETDGLVLAGASFKGPVGIARGADGTFYVTDFTGHTVRKFTLGGSVTTLAGAPGASGYQDGSGTGAKFSGPMGIAVDAAGNVYVADSGNHAIRRVTSAGEVTTLAGDPAASPIRIDGLGKLARFSSPSLMALDPGRNLIVADTGNNAIRKVTPGGLVTTLAGREDLGFVDGSAGQVRFFTPTGVVTDGAGNIYVADAGNAVVRKLDTGGNVTTIGGNGDSTAGSVDGTGSGASLVSPTGITLIGSTLYITDSLDHLVRRLTP